MVKRVVNSRSKFSYFFEFLIIIAGIMVSFILNEWRESKKLDRRKDHLLVEINHDLKNDSLILEQVIYYYKTMIRSHDSLLSDRNKTFDKDSLSLYLDHVSSYYPFNETSASYSRILNDKDLTVETKDTIINEYMNLHNLVYPNYHEWTVIEKEFVLNTLLPYMDKNAPFIYPLPERRSFDGSAFYELRKQDTFMNFVKSGRLYKKSILMTSQGVLGYIKKIKSATNQHLAKKQEK